MAKKTRKGPNKSQLVRDYMDSHPELGPTEIAAAVSKERSIEVKPQFVSMIKLNLKKKAAGGKSLKSVGRPKVVKQNASGSVSIDLLRAAKKFVAQMGGVGNAKAAVDILAELQG
jgi:hypothetical protein